MKRPEQWTKRINDKNELPDQKGYYMPIDEAQVLEIQLDASTSRPDDEMPISEEWLLSAGFQKTKYDFIVSIGEMYVSNYIPKLFKCMSIRLTSRRHVRLLAELLGVTLNEQGEGQKL